MMNVDTARSLLSLHRADRPVDPRIQKAINMAETDELLRNGLRDQLEFDAQIVGAIRDIRPPEGFRKQLAEYNSAATSSKARQVFNPAILCAIIGILLLIGFGVYMKMEAEKNFPGRDWVESFIELNDRMTGAELEPTSMSAGELADNMMLHGFDEFSLPPEIASLPAAGWRVFRHGQSGHHVAQLAFEQHPSVAFVFRASDFAVEPGDDNQWHIFAHEGWAAAIKKHGKLCVLITSRGTEAAMQSYVRSLKP